MLSFTQPAFLWLLGLAVPLILLHFLRQRREERAVAGVFLWRRAIQQTAARKRLVSTLLLLLQLLILLIATLLLSGARFGEPSHARRVIIVDSSVSMLAHMPGGSPADRAPGLVQSLAREATEHIVVRAGLTPQMIEDDVVFGDARADLAAAVRVGLAALPGSEVHVITDQAITLQDEETLAADGLVVHNMSGGALRENVGITALDVTDSQVFAVVTSNISRPVEIPLTFRTANAAHHSTLLVPANGSSGIHFPHTGEIGEWELHITEDDALAHDNSVYFVNEPITIATNDSSTVFERLFAALPNVVSMFGANPERLAVDIMFVQRNQPGAIPITSSVRFPAPGLDGESLVVGSFVREHPLLRFVSLENISLFVPSGASLSEGNEWTVIARATNGTPLIQAQQSEAGWHVEFAFHPAESDFPLRTAFPAFFFNLVQAAQRSVLHVVGEHGVYVPSIVDGAAFNVLEPSETRVPTVLDELSQRELLLAVRSHEATPLTVSEAPQWPIVLVAAVAALLLAEWIFAVRAWSRVRVGTVEG